MRVTRAALAALNTSSTSLYSSVCACVVVGCADMVTTSAMVSSRSRLTATVHCVDTGVIHHAVCVDHRWLANIAADTCTAAAAAAARK